MQQLEQDYAGPVSYRRTGSVVETMEPGENAHRFIYNKWGVWAGGDDEFLFHVYVSNDTRLVLSQEVPLTEGYELHAIGTPTRNNPTRLEGSAIWAGTIRAYEHHRTVPPAHGWRTYPGQPVKGIAEMKVNFAPKYDCCVYGGFRR